MNIKTEVRPADAEGIARAAELLRRGELVALPTETVYGIAADARNGEAVSKIFVAKGRPQDNPLIVHVTGPEMLHGLVSEVPERAQLLMAAFCPGPLTIIMPRGPEVAAECCAGLDTVGIRMPSHPVARAVIEASGCAFAAPSANLSGKPSPTNAQDVFTDMDGRLPLIRDGGECDWGVESTVVSVVGEKPTLFRPGHITLEDLERALGEEVEVSKAILEKLPEGAVVRSPGMKYKHYAPKADVTLLDGTFEQFKAYVDAHAAERQQRRAGKQDLAGELVGVCQRDVPGRKNRAAAEAECDKLCVVTAPFEVSVERIAARDGISPEMAARRLNAQTPEAVLTARADYILPNTSTREALAKAANELCDTLIGEGCRT